MKAVILAAGDNTRFRKENDSHNKLLYPVLGMPLIERTIRSAKIAGIDEFIIVTGYQDNAIKKLLGDGRRLGVSIEYVHNKSWRGENGTSVYTASNKLDEFFILLMGDHLFDSKTLSSLKRVKIGNQEVVLAIDKKIEIYPHLHEATKVKIEKGKTRKIVMIGKEVKDYNAIDTGMFVCSPHLFDVLKGTIQRSKFYLTDAMRILAKEGRLKGYDIKDGFWADIDTHSDLKIASQRLFERLVKPSEEGPISKHVNRHFSHLITRAVINTPITPNQITLLSLLLAIISGILLANSSYLFLAVGGLLAQISSIIDGVDGEVARIRLMSSQFGAWFDTMVDRYGDITIIAGASIGAYISNPSFPVLITGILALTGSILSSYSAHTFKTTFGRSFNKIVKPPFTLPSGRDVRLLTIFIGGILNLMLPALLLIAFLTHYSVLSKLFLARREH